MYLLEFFQFHFIHESGVGIIIGAIVGFGIYKYDESYYRNIVIYKFINILQFGFNKEIFFYFLLPSIIFAGGYNLKKKRFFKEFFYINLYGLVGTLVNFSVTYGLTYNINNYS